MEKEGLLAGWIYKAANNTFQVVDMIQQKQTTSWYDYIIEWGKLAHAEKLKHLNKWIREGPRKE